MLKNNKPSGFFRESGDFLKPFKRVLSMKSGSLHSLNIWSDVIEQPDRTFARTAIDEGSAFSSFLRGMASDFVVHR
jgi:hypothetical protein